MLVEDGKGRGYKAGVTAENKIDVCAITNTIDLYCNQKNGVSYSVIITETPTTSGNCFCYIKNEDTKDLIVSSIKVYCASDEVCAVKLSDSGTPVGGSDGVFANRKAGCGNVPTATCKVGSNITGVSGGTVVETIGIKGGWPSARYEWYSGLIIPRNHTMTFYVETGGSLIRATISLHFCECE
jgi:hypothetical protein